MFAGGGCFTIRGGFTVLTDYEAVMEWTSRASVLVHRLPDAVIAGIQPPSRPGFRAFALAVRNPSRKSQEIGSKGPPELAGIAQGE